MELVINFSGGKDSTAMLAYLCEKYPDAKKHVVYADTGWEHDGTEEWCRQIVARFGLELHTVRSKTKTFLSMAEARGKFPGMNQRQCTSDLKRDPVMTWVRQNVKDRVVINCMGIRSEESTGRKNQKRLKRDTRETNSVRTVWQWQPIKDWTETEVLGYLEAKGLPLHPVYKYLRRFSCRMCIYMTQHDREQVQQNDPQAVEIIHRIEEKIGFSFFQDGFLKDLLTLKPTEGFYYELNYKKGRAIFRYNGQDLGRNYCFVNKSGFYRVAESQLDSLNIQSASNQLYE